MQIVPRKTKNKGMVYDVRWRDNGLGSKRHCVTYERRVDAEDFVAGKNKELSEKRRGFECSGSFDDTTLALEAKNWLEDKELELSDSWYDRAEDIIDRILIPRYGNCTPNIFNLKMIRMLQKELKVGNKRKATKLYANATVNRVTEVLCAILTHSVKLKRIPSNPMHGYAKLPKDHQEMAFWSKDEAKDFLRFVNQLYPREHPKRWIYGAVLLFVNCGLRAGEAWGLKPSDICEKTLFIKRQWLEREKKFDVLKGKRSTDANDLPYRHVLLHSYVKEELEHLIHARSVQSDQTIFYTLVHVKDSTTDESIVRVGGPRDHRSFQRIFERLLELWGGRRIRVHDLRHTAITLWVHAKIDPKTIQEMAGHADIATTWRYVHSVGGSVSAIAERYLVMNENEFTPREVGEDFQYEKSSVLQFRES